MYAGVKESASQAANMDNKYHVTETVSKAASQAAGATAKFAEDHAVKERTAAATSAAANASAVALDKAKELNEKYHVSSNLSSAAASTWSSFQTAVDKNSSAKK
jgi:hypothetical protein